VAVLLQIFLIDLDHRPPGYLAGTRPILVAADVEPGIEFFRQAIFADVFRSADLDNGAEIDVPRARYGVAAAADIRTGGGRARVFIGLLGDRVVTRYLSPNLLVGHRHSRSFGRDQGKRQQQRRGVKHA
jgi:hypothetical protein